MEIDRADQDVRLCAYRLLLQRGVTPLAVEIADDLSRTEADIRVSLERLYKQKALALMPESREILMASPWSAVPTIYVTECGGRNWWANCAWDALAIPAAMKQPGRVSTSCACCGESMVAEVDGRRLVAGDGVVHIALPARIWWQDIFFT